MATTAQPTTGHEVEIGRIIGRAFSTIGRNPGVTLGIAFLFSAVPGTIISLLSQKARPDNVNLSQSFVTWLAVMMSGALVAMILQLITQGALMRATVRAATGEPASFGDSASIGLKAALPLLGLGILSALGIMLGMVLLFVPGIILWVMWSVAGPALVAERLGPIEAMKRSAQLTGGARWKVFGLLLLIVIFSWILGAVMSGVMMGVYGGPQGMAVALQNGLPLAWLVFNALVTTITSAVGAIIAASLYIELREWKEGPAIDRLAEVFR